MFRNVITYFPGFVCVLLDLTIRHIHNTTFPFLGPLLSPLKLKRRTSGLCYGARGLIASDRFSYQLRDGVAEAVPELHEVTGPSSIVCKDGREIANLDAIIFCTGYFQDYSIIEGPGNPFDPDFSADRFEKYKQARFRKKDQPYPRLFYGLLSERYPSSLAILGHLVTLQTILIQNDLATMALAALWSGSYPLPSQSIIKKQIDQRYEFVVKTLDSGPMPYLGHEASDNIEGVYQDTQKPRGAEVSKTK